MAKKEVGQTTWYFCLSVTRLESQRGTKRWSTGSWGCMSISDKHSSFSPHFLSSSSIQTLNLRIPSLIMPLCYMYTISYYTNLLKTNNIFVWVLCPWANCKLRSLPSTCSSKRCITFVGWLNEFVCQVVFKPSILGFQVLLYPCATCTLLLITVI